MVDLRQIAIAAAVAILSALFVILLVDAVYPEPKYSNYCKDEFELRTKPIPVGEPKCDYEYGEEYSRCLKDGGIPRFKTNETGCLIFDKCDFCNRVYDDARKVYARNIFIIIGLVGVGAIFSGTLWRIEFLATGIMFGGIILLFYATVRFFGEADKVLRVIVIFVELLLVLWVGYKKLYVSKKRQKKK
ncbi:MAG: hypothetical protein QW818_02235 [Candidatus Aenigmatarchaeota archaeon]|nr:hypothetical protein [Candidatus Aenigmarchaeota archaeon]